MYQYKSNGSPLGTVFPANITQTEQNINFDKMKHLFICVAAIVPSSYFFA